MTISFQCPHCGKQHKVKDELAGAKARCRCGSRVTVPAAEASHARASSSASAPAPSTVSDALSVDCPGCGRCHQADLSMAGRQARCGCGTVISMPALAPAPTPPEAPYEGDEFKLQPLVSDTAEAKRQSEDELLAQYNDPNSVESRMDRIREMEAGRKMAAAARDDSESLEESILGSGAIGGLVAMAVAAVWFIVGYSNGVIFFYPPVLFLFGLAAFVSDLLDLI